MSDSCNCARCVDERRRAASHASQDPARLKDIWLRQSLLGGCMALCHQDCYNCGADGDITIRRTFCVIPGSARRVSLSEHLLAALGMQRRQGANQQLQFVDVSDMKVLRKWAGDLRGRISRRKLKSLGMCNELSLSPDVTERSRLRKAGVAGALLNIIEAGPDSEMADQEALDDYDNDARSETDVRFRDELTSVIWVLSVATSGNLLAIPGDQTTQFARNLMEKLSLLANYPELDDTEQFTLAHVYQRAGETAGARMDLQRLFPFTRSSTHVGAHVGSDDDDMPPLEDHSSDGDADSEHSSSSDRSEDDVAHRGQQQGHGAAGGAAKPAGAAASAEPAAKLADAHICGKMRMERAPDGSMVARLDATEPMPLRDDVRQALADAIAKDKPAADEGSIRREVTERLLALGRTATGARKVEAFRKLMAESAVVRESVDNTPPFYASDMLNMLVGLAADPQNMTRKDIESAARDQLVVYKLCAAQTGGSAGAQPGAGAANGTASAGMEQGGAAHMNGSAAKSSPRSKGSGKTAASEAARAATDAADRMAGLSSGTRGPTTGSSAVAAGTAGTTTATTSGGAAKAGGKISGKSSGKSGFSFGAALGMKKPKAGAGPSAAAKADGAGTKTTGSAAAAADKASTSAVAAPQNQQDSPGAGPAAAGTGVQHGRSSSGGSNASASRSVQPPPTKPQGTTAGSPPPSEPPAFITQLAASAKLGAEAAGETAAGGAAASSEAKRAKFKRKRQNAKKKAARARAAAADDGATSVTSNAASVVSQGSEVSSLEAAPAMPEAASPATQAQQPAGAAAVEPSANADALTAELLSEPPAATATAEDGHESDDDPFAWMRPGGALLPAGQPDAPQQPDTSVAAPAAPSAAAATLPTNPAASPAAKPAPRPQPRPGSAQAARNAFTTKRTREPKRAAAKPKPAGPLNPFAMLEDGASDAEGNAAAASSGDEDSEEDVAVIVGAAAASAASAHSGPPSRGATPPLPEPQRQQRASGGGGAASSRPSSGGSGAPGVPVEFALPAGPNPAARDGPVGGAQTTAGVVVCRVCGWSGRRAAALAHFTSREHEFMCEAMGEGACQACGVRCPSQGHFQTHNRSKKHLERIAWLDANAAPQQQQPPPPQRNPAPAAPLAFRPPPPPQQPPPPVGAPLQQPAAPVNEEVSTNFECPLTMDVMSDPVICSDGYTYERAAIEEWMAKSNTSPMTGLQLPDRNLTPNRALQGAIRAMMGRRG